MTYKDKYLQWLSFADEDTKSELESITDDKEIEDRFYKDLAFGTGGLRGIMGAGSNRMNRYTVVDFFYTLNDFRDTPSAVLFYSVNLKFVEFYHFINVNMLVMKWINFCIISRVTGRHK